MKEIGLLIITLVLAFFFISSAEFLQSTRFGKRQEAFHFRDTKELPFILRNYLAESNIKYTVYNIPNYIEDLFTYNETFKSVNKFRSSKYSLILFAPLKEDKIFDNFTSSLEDSMKNQVDKFNIVYVYQDHSKGTYLNTFDNKAFIDLYEKCKYFCLVDLDKNILFTFKNYTNSEMSALPVLIQQYAFMKK